MVSNTGAGGLKGSADKTGGPVGGSEMFHTFPGRQSGASISPGETLNQASPGNRTPRCGPAGSDQNRPEPGTAAPTHRVRGQVNSHIIRRTGRAGWGTPSAQDEPGGNIPSRNAVNSGNTQNIGAFRPAQLLICDQYWLLVQWMIRRNSDIWRLMLILSQSRFLILRIGQEAPEHRPEPGRATVRGSYEFIS